MSLRRAAVMSAMGQKQTFSTQERHTAPSGHSALPQPCRLRVMCGRLRVGKKKLHVAVLVGAAMWPLSAVHMTAGHNALRGIRSRSKAR